MQTNCRLKNYTGNSPETDFSFSFWRLVKYWVNNTFSTLHSYFYCCRSFSFQGGHQALKNKRVKNQTIFIQHSSKLRTANATAFVKARVARSKSTKNAKPLVTKMPNHFKKCQTSWNRPNAVDFDITMWVIWQKHSGTREQGANYII